MFKLIFMKMKNRAYRVTLGFFLIQLAYVQNGFAFVDIGTEVRLRETRQAPLGRVSRFGEKLDTISLPAGWEATVFASGLKSPDGLALGPHGEIYVAEEGSGKISQLFAGGARATVATGLSHPEGVATDEAGNLYVVEDVRDGRLLMIRPGVNEPPKVLLQKLTFPEGVVVAGGKIYFTESNVEATKNPLRYRTRVSVFDPSSDSKTRLSQRYFLFSFSGITSFEDRLYFTNEASGKGTRRSVFVREIQHGPARTHLKGMPYAEALRFNERTGDLFVVSESKDLGGHTGGAIYQVSPSGAASVFASGFGSIEDVLVGRDGSLFVSEDSSGMVILLQNRSLDLVQHVPSF